MNIIKYIMGWIKIFIITVFIFKINKFELNPRFPKFSLYSLS
jgi:hypothetical protein